MEAYTEFATVYDTFMDNVPYEAWKKYLVDILKAEGINDGLLLELGCGTGRMTRLLAAEGYDMIGVDNSEEMLSVAREYTMENTEILYLLQDMREFELYGTIRAVVSVCDSMNYIMSEEDLRQVFSLVNNYLDPGGIFIFDMNTRYKYEELLGDNSFCETREDSSFIWENYYDEETRINEYDLTLFIPEAGELYRRYAETHYQRNYKVGQIVDFLQQAGLVCEGMYDDYTDAGVKADSERITFVTRKE